MVDRKTVLKWAHLGVVDVEPYRSIIAENRRVAQEHIAEIQAELEQKNTDLRVRAAGGTRLQVASRYAGGRKKR